MTVYQCSVGDRTSKNKADIDNHIASARFQTDNHSSARTITNFNFSTSDNRDNSTTNFGNISSTAENRPFNPVNGPPAPVNRPFNPVWGPTTASPAPEVEVPVPERPIVTAPGPSGSGGGPSTPSVAYPYNVALKSGISHGEMDEFLKKTLRDYNKKNGTSFWVTPSGMRVNGTGAHMSPGQQQAFNSTIPVHAVDYKYGKAIDKALAGDTTDLKNLDMFFFKAHRPAGGYSKEYLTKEKQARGMGITVAELDKRNAAKKAQVAPKPKVAAPVATTTSNTKASSQSDSQAAKKPEPVKEEKPSVKIPDNTKTSVVATNASNDSVLPSVNRTSEQAKNQEKPQQNSQVVVEKEQKRTVPIANTNSDESSSQPLPQIEENKQNQKQEQTQTFNSVSDVGGVVVPTNGYNGNNSSQSNRENSGNASDDPIEIDNTKVPGSGFGIQNEKREEALASSQGNSEENRRDAEAHERVFAAQAEAEEKQQQALVVATAKKQSAKEARLKKIMEMRRPYMGGAASVNGASDAMVVPPIVPASQVPPPPLP